MTGSISVTESMTGSVRESEAASDADLTMNKLFGRAKVLIVDDLRENVFSLAHLIDSDDIEIFTATTPEEALNHILDHDFALCFLDVQMPFMSGFELARVIRGVDKGRHLPIIFVTAQASESSLILEGYESGAVDLLFKPLDPHIVRSKVRVFIKLDQQSRQLQRQIVEMQQLKNEAEAANVAKSRFLANMSHEIRTPLSAVLGFAEVMAQEDVSPEERDQYLASISRNGQLLLRIIDDILDLSRIEAQRLELDTTPFRLDELLNDLEATLSHRASEKGIRLTFTTDGEVDRFFISDPLRIKQILLNIVGNAIKFTEKGDVVVVSKVRETFSGEDSRCTLTFTVKDSGVGISDDEARRLFEPFSQADTSTRRRFGGTGLGLTISKQLARSLGGDVVLIRSESGAGSTFEVTIRAPYAGSEVAMRAPRSKQERTAQKRTAQDPPSAGWKGRMASMDGGAPDALNGKKVLVVDDVQDNRILIERYLKPAGVEVGTASGGMEAIERVQGGSWDLVLMDIQMPNMDGYEATTQLRSLGFKKPIIALTAHAMKEELERCMRAGCDLAITKPISKPELVRRLQEAFRL